MSIYEKIQESTTAFIIAEAGVNHNGDINIAKRLVDVALESGADAVKFQTFRTECIISKSAPKAQYQAQTTGSDESQFDMVKKLELSVPDHYTLAEYCKEKGILFLSTPFDEPSVDLLDELNVPLFKVPSGEITNLPILHYIARKQKPIILSTGMSDIQTVADALRAIYSEDNNQVILLHCVTAYPTPMDQVNLRAMVSLRENFSGPVGLSDHTLGTEAALAAVALGAKVIEKHFTLDKEMPGPDHQASLEPDELKVMVEAIRRLESALGSGVKQPAPCEIINMPVARKSVVAAQPIKKGETITEGHLTLKRPGHGIQPKEFDKVVGCQANCDIDEDEVITWNLLCEKEKSVL